MKLYKWLLVVFSVLLTGYSASALTASFTASPASGCAPLVVTFANGTTPSTGTSYVWSFGPSSSSTLTNPSTSFTTPGTHVVTLTATNGAAVSTYTLAITVYPNPTVSFTADDTTVCPCTPVTFTSTSVGGVPGPMTYSWAWGDGLPAGSAGTETHSYCAPGNYNVTLFVTNATGCVASLVKTNYIHVYTPPIANFTWAPFAICNPPGTVTFTSTSTGTAPLSYLWDFDPGSGTGPTPSATYATVGSHNPKLIVTDGNGCKDTVTLGPVIVDTIRAEFTYPTTVCLYSYVNFTNTSSPHVTRTWDYGDFSPTTTGLHGGHAYSAPGTYTVTLTINNPPCTKTVTHVINVVPGPAASFTSSPSQPCPAPATLTYTATGPAGTIYNWLFEGSTAAVGNPVSHTYATNGVKTVKMITIDPVTGCRDTVTSSDIIYDLILDINATPLEGCKPLTVNFGSFASTTIPGPGVAPYPYSFSSYSWSWGDGSTIPGSGPSPTHTFTEVGTYKVVCNAITSNGCPVSDSLTILVGAPPVVTFSASPTHICYNDTPVTFFPTIITGPVDRWVWHFGDDGTTIIDTTASPVTHNYTIPGIFTVTVTPYYHGCPGVPFVRTNYITVDSPKAIISWRSLCFPRTNVQFGDSSLGDDSHVWMFGDGDTSTLDNPMHSYPTTGIYTVRLATYNASSGCRDTATQIIDLTPTVFDIHVDDNTVCKYDSVTFWPTFTSGGALDYVWSVWNPYPTTLVGPLATVAGLPTSGMRFYATSGQHTVRLVITDLLYCPDTVIRTNFITVGKPVPAFSGLPVSGCVPLAVIFTDASTAAAGTTLASYEWTFGDGGTSTVTTPITSHTYTAAGTYNVTEIVVDNLGCKDTVVHPGYITAWDPTASFTVSNTHPCSNTPVTFTSTSTGGVVSYSWDFGDFTTSTLATPAHTYSAPGTYNVTLTVTDSHGCSDMVVMTSLITVADPVAAFHMSDSVSVCPPLFVNFINTSTGAVSYEWDLGGTGSSFVMSPSNMFISSGFYPVRLIVTSVYGCKDTVIHPVNIFGYAGAFTYSPLQGCAPFAVTFRATLSNVPDIVWDFSDGVTYPTAFTDSVVHIYTTPGAYVPKLILTDNTGCQTSSTGLDTIKVETIYPKMSTDPSPVCIGIPFTMIDSSTAFWTPPNEWEWTYDGNTSTLQSPTHTISTPGTYPITLKVKNAWGCEATLTNNIVINPPPDVTASADTVVCLTDPATLTGFGAVTYTWAGAGTLSCTTCNPVLATPTEVTTYTVVGTDASGCVDSATVTVGLRTHTISRAWGDTAVCQGVSVQLFDTGGTTYLWLPPLGLNSNTIYNPIATPPYTTIYTVIARLGSCIPDTNQVTLTIWPLPSINAGPDQKVLAGYTAQLQATGKDIAKLTWWPGETLSCTDCFNPVASMTVNTTYTADALSDRGCKNSDSVKILLYCDNSMVFIPNAFTPNGDGENDVFYPRGAGLKEIKTFRIYNRWGELVYSQEGIKLNDASVGWDGSHKGSEPRPDVYVYIMEAICFTGEPVNVKGDVTILK